MNYLFIVMKATSIHITLIKSCITCFYTKIGALVNLYLKNDTGVKKLGMDSCSHLFRRSLLILSHLIELNAQRYTFDNLLWICVLEVSRKTLDLCVSSNVCTYYTCIVIPVVLLLIYYNKRQIKKNICT